MEDKYLKAPWHSTKDELPSYSGARCMCYHSWFNCEMEMIFHKSRKDSGYLDSFKEVNGKEYDYNMIKYWCYYTDYYKEHPELTDRFDTKKCEAEIEKLITPLKERYKASTIETALRNIADNGI